MHEFAHEFVDEFFANFVHEFKYEIHTNSRKFVQIRMNFLREKLVMLQMACTVIISCNLHQVWMKFCLGLQLVNVLKNKDKFLPIMCRSSQFGCWLM